MTVLPTDPSSAAEPPDAAADPRERLLSLLPAHLRARDAETGGVLTALLTAVAGEVAVLEEDLRALYAGWFVETCAEWQLPYLADLIGLTELPPELGQGTSRRALVANTIGYRRRKGTVTVLEQVAADVTGWPARAVEFYPRVVTAAHLDHVRLDRPAAAAVRDAVAMRQLMVTEAAAGTLTPGLAPVAHTAEVRGIGSGRGRYGLPAVGVFLYPLRVDEVGRRGWARAAPGPDGRYTVDPVGREIPLFAPPTLAVPTGTRSAAPSVPSAHPAGGPELPVPLSPHELLSRLRSARARPDGPALPLGVRVDGVELRPDALRVAGLEDLDRSPRAPGTQVVVDPTTGRLTVHPAAGPDRAGEHDVRVRYAAASSADIGAGTYDRAPTHAQVMASDRYDGPVGTLAQVAVRADAAAPTPAATPPAAPTLAAALVRLARVDGTGTRVLSVGDNAGHRADLRVEVAAGDRLVLVAAAWPVADDAPGEPGCYLPDGLRAHLRGTLRITGGAGSSVVLDGILLEGDLVVDAGGLGALTVSQSTVTGRIRTPAPDAEQPRGALSVRLVRSLVGGVALGPLAADLSVLDSVLDPVLDPALDPAPAGPPAVDCPAGHARFDGVTVRGAVTLRSIDASSCVFDGPLDVADRQTGSLRYCYSRPGSPTPRRFRCVPAEVVVSAGPAPAPVYASTRPGAPDYLSLSAACSPRIRTGGEDGAEMGVHHHLRRPSRVTAASRQLAPYLPVGREIRMFGS